MKSNNPLSDLDRRMYAIGQELQEMEADVEPEVVTIRGDEFDNREWLWAEYEALDRQRRRFEMVIQPDGSVDYSQDG